MRKPEAILLLFLSAFTVIAFCQDASNDDGSNELNEVVVLLFLIVGLGIGIIVNQFLSIFGEYIPYTCLVFLLGLALSQAYKEDGPFGESVSRWIDINADLVLFVFLPPLIFGEAMSLNWYHLKGGLLQSVILAGPGVLIGASLMGVITYYFLPYNWSWNLCMVFGSILSATDPVAVVALLKSVGASPKLTILIVGESLLNDGSAMVLFTIFYNAIQGTRWTPLSIFIFSVEAAVGSVVFGIVCGLITVRWLRTAHRPLNDTDVTMQIAMTICCAYIVFFVAQYLLEVSGVLACCGAGAMLAWLANPIILNHESMHNVWGMIEWCLNTLIFLLAGLVIGYHVLKVVCAIDWLYLVILYALLMLVRSVTLFILFPAIRSIGHRCTVNEAIFMSWAGLRGALGMALALLVRNNSPEDISTETTRLFFFVGGIAALTLVINAPTAKMLLYSLGLLSSDSAEKLLVTGQIKKKLQFRMNKVIDQMAQEFSLTPEDIGEVRQSCTLLQKMDLQALNYRDTERESTLLANVHHDRNSLEGDRNPSTNILFNLISNRNNSRTTSSMSGFKSLGHGASEHRQLSNSHRLERMGRLLSNNTRNFQPNFILNNELLIYVRGVFLEIVRVKYWHFIESGKLPRLSFSAQFLLYSIDVSLDDINSVENNGYVPNKTPAQDWICVEEELNSKPITLQLLLFIERYCPMSFCTNILGHILSRKEKREVYVLSSFIEAHEHAQKKIHSFLLLEGDGDEQIQIPEEQRVIKESKMAVEEAKKRLNSMSTETVSAIRSKQAARMVLAKEAEIVKNLLSEGLLTTKYAEEFLEEISHDTARIERKRDLMYREHGTKRGQKLREEMSFRRTLVNTDVIFGLSPQKISHPVSVISQENNNNSNKSEEEELISPLLQDSRSNDVEYTLHKPDASDNDSESENIQELFTNDMNSFEEEVNHQN